MGRGEDVFFSINPPYAWLFNIDLYGFAERGRAPGIRHPQDRIIRRRGIGAAAQIGEIDHTDRRDLFSCTHSNTGRKSVPPPPLGAR